MKIIMIDLLPPGAILILGGLLVPLLPSRVKPWSGVVFPVLGFMHLLALEKGFVHRGRRNEERLDEECLDEDGDDERHHYQERQFPPERTVGILLLASFLGVLAESIQDVVVRLFGDLTVGREGIRRFRSGLGQIDRIRLGSLYGLL